VLSNPFIYGRRFSFELADSAMNIPGDGCSSHIDTNGVWDNIWRVIEIIFSRELRTTVPFDPEIVPLHTQISPKMSCRINGVCAKCVRQNP